MAWLIPIAMLALAAYLWATAGIAGDDLVFMFRRALACCIAALALFLSIGMALA